MNDSEKLYVIIKKTMENKITTQAHILKAIKLLNIYKSKQSMSPDDLTDTHEFSGSTLLLKFKKWNNKNISLLTINFNNCQNPRSIKVHKICTKNKQK